MGYFDFYHNELTDQQIDELHGIMAIHESAGMRPYDAALQAAKDKLQQSREYRAEIQGLILEAAKTISSDNGETTINKLLSAISRAKGNSKKDELFLSVYGDNRKLLIEAAILRLPPGIYTLDIEGMAAPAIVKVIQDKYGVAAGVSISKPILAGMAIRYPKAIHTKFTHGLQEIQISPNRGILESALSDKIDAGAHQAATSPKNNKPEPTPAQQAAGNYAKGSVYLYGLEIAIENPEGSTRKGVSPDGKAWESRMYHHYGFVRRTKGADGDQVDVFVGSQPSSEKVFVIDQVNPDGKFDEHKVMLAFRTLADARKGYLKNYEEGWQGLGAITEMSVDEFKEWLKDGDTLKPVDGAILEAGLNLEVKPIFESAGKVVMVLAGDEVDGYVPVKMPNKRPAVDQLTLRDRAEGYYKDHFQGKDAHRADLSTPIRISNKGLDEFIHFSSNPDKLRLVPAIKAIIEHGEYEGREPISHPRQKDRIVAFHLISANVVLNGKTMNVRIELGEDQHGHLFYDLFPDKQSHDMKRKSRIRGVESESTGNAAHVGRFNPSHDLNIPLTPDAVKPVFEAAGGAYDYRTAIEQATTFEDIQAVFARLFPVKKPTKEELLKRYYEARLQRYQQRGQYKPEISAQYALRDMITDIKHLSDEDAVELLEQEVEDIEKVVKENPAFIH